MDLGEAEWTLKLSKRDDSKSRRQDIDEYLKVPLPRQAVEILEDVHALTGNDVYVFPGARDHNRPMSENAIALDRCLHQAPPNHRSVPTALNGGHLMSAEPQRTWAIRSTSGHVRRQIPGLRKDNTPAAVRLNAILFDQPVPSCIPDAGLVNTNRNLLPVLRVLSGPQCASQEAGTGSRFPKVAEIELVASHNLTVPDLDITPSITRP